MRPRVFLSLLVVLTLPSLALGQVLTWFTWDSGDNSTRWDRPANWVGNTVPTSDNATGVAFGTGNQLFVDTVQSRTLNSLRFDAGSATFTLFNNQLIFESASGSASLLQLSANRQNIDSSLVLTSNLGVSVTGAGALHLTGKMEGAGTLTKTGTGGDLVLAGTGFNYTGQIQINQGTARAASAYALGNSSGQTTVANGATLSVGSLNGSSLALNETIRVSGSGVGGNGALVNLGNANTLLGPVVLDANSRVQSNAGSLVLAGGVTGSGKTLTVGGAGNVTTTAAIATGSGGLVKEGSGTLTLGASNTFTGATSILGGTVLVQAAAVFSDTSPINIASGSLLNLNGFSESVGSLMGDGQVSFGGGKLTLLSGSSVFGGDFSGPGTLVVRAGASLTLTDSFNNPNINILLDGGTLNLGTGVNQVFGSLTVTSSSVIDFGTSGATTGFFQNVAIQNGETLTVTNWTDAVDYFYVQNNPGPQGTPPTNQVDFTQYPVDNWTGNDTRWVPFANVTYGQLTPVPEPSTYGAIFLGLAAAWAAWRRRRD